MKSVIILMKFERKFFQTSYINMLYSFILTSGFSRLLIKSDHVSCSGVKNRKSASFAVCGALYRFFTAICCGL